MIGREEGERTGGGQSPDCSSPAIEQQLSEPKTEGDFVFFLGFLAGLSRKMSNETINISAIILEQTAK